MSRSVLYVSKPVDPPINDGTKHVVLTLARRLTRYRPRVMTTKRIRELDAPLLVDPIYDTASSYAPSLLNNLRAARHLALGPKASIWNFVFAPNARSSQMGRWLKAMRRVPVVQTVASRPKQFENVSSLLFGDIVVTQSRDTRDRLLQALVSRGEASAALPRIEVILPPLGDVRVPTLDETNALRRSLDVELDVPILLYPGDLEVSHGARMVKAATSVMTSRHPTAVVVFAYRSKTAPAEGAAQDLKRDLDPRRVRFVREVPDILALLRTSAAVLFPVDELYGKVDIPIVLLEAMALSTPVITYDEGPLAELEGVEVVQPGDPVAIAEAGLSLIDDHARRSRCIEAQRLALGRNHDASRLAEAYERLYDELTRHSRSGAPGADPGG